MALTAAFASLAIGYGPASAEDAARQRKIEGVVRVAATQAGILRHCRKFHTINESLSFKVTQTVRGVLDKALGPQEAQAAIDEEGKRIEEDVERLGEQPWYDAQRDKLDADDLEIFVH